MPAARTSRCQPRLLTPASRARSQENGVDAIHPGYGFLSESPEFADACAANNITFVGPKVENLNMFADKTSARAAAIAAGVPVVPGTDGPVLTADQAVAFVEGSGLPIIIKAAMGGGGKGMRVVRNMDDLVPFFESAASEALAAFGDGSVRRARPRTRRPTPRTAAALGCCPPKSPPPPRRFCRRRGLRCCVSLRISPALPCVEYPACSSAPAVCPCPAI